MFVITNISEGVPANHIVATKKAVVCGSGWSNRIVIFLYLLK